LVSIFLVGISIFIRLRMAESPLFSKIKAEGKVSKNPLRESFGRKENLKMVLLALFGAVMAQGVVWYTGQFYAQTFLERTLKIEFEQTRYILCVAILAATPFFLVFGAWSDRIGRKPIMLAGVALALLTYQPIYQAMYGLAEGHDAVRILSTSAFWAMTGLVFLQILYVTMVYGPIAAFLVELFPTRIRYTSMSLPYHIGNGIFGGLTPYIATRLVNESKHVTADGSTDPFFGLWYPMGIAAVGLLIGVLFLPKAAAVWKRFTGLIWMALSVFVFVYLCYRADLEISLAIASGKADEVLNQRMFWWIILPIFTPIMVGLGLFGWYAWRGEYEEKM
jgi:MFS family permease